MRVLLAKGDEYGCFDPWDRDNLDLDTILVVAFAGAVILLLVVRLFAGGGARRRSWT